ncbi:putative Mg2+ transporter-C (MgtC) family protein [Rhodococcus sp. PvR044]|jgi:putative Mg2+ transporter-C (MgtC) family protein|uniref:MgtC/SapB family protein n=1 Tax=Rhodococcus TaxID=1827 RepID=UPI001AEA7089|nr:MULTISPECIES: MgtC/SapB family protein [Rhodococcus]MBP1159304.1 putative Mg2+ transporter-C (MgtC) family protein [Rhodococcus sp. PvR099]MCZ4556870.1 MgtC/SapB family protein [Rhodococcus maanshanensis]
MDTTVIILRVVLGLALGAAVGIERQWRSRLAGLRTNALVSLGATLFVILGAYSFDGPGADPTRVAAQIVSGIGFLGAGVIMKQGASITGLNTAATLWATAAIGALAGGGMYWAAVIGTVAIMTANTLLRPLGRLMDHQPATKGREMPAAEYVFEVTCRDDAEAHVRGLAVQSVSRPEFRLRSVRSFDLPETGEVTVLAELTADERDDRLLESAVSRLSMEPLVTHVRWSVETDSRCARPAAECAAAVARSRPT